MRTRIPLPAFAPSVLALRPPSSSSAQAGVGRRADAVRPLFRQEPIHYDNFEWHIYTTDHFEIYYYPELEQHLARVAGYAESAYQQISADLKHDLPVQGSADSVQDAQRVRAGEHRARGADRKASARLPSRCVSGW